MKFFSLLLVITILVLFSACTRHSAYQSSSMKENYTAKWSNYEQLSFIDALNFLSNKELQDTKKNKEAILDEYLRSIYYDEYKARQETKHQLAEFMSTHMNTLINSHIPNKKYISPWTKTSLGSYEPQLGGFRLQENEFNIVNQRAKTGHSSDSWGAIFSYTQEDAGLTSVKIRLDQSSFILPATPEQATEYIKEKNIERISNIVYVYKLSDCQRNLKEKESFICYGEIEEGYIYDVNLVGKTTKPKGQLIKLSNSDVGYKKEIVREKCNLMISNCLN